MAVTVSGKNYALINACESLTGWDGLVDALVTDFFKQGRWKIENNRMIFYDTDNTTPIRTFELKNKAGQLAEKDIFERTPL